MLGFLSGWRPIMQAIPPKGVSPWYFKKAALATIHPCERPPSIILVESLLGMLSISVLTMFKIKSAAKLTPS